MAYNPLYSISHSLCHYPLSAPLHYTLYLLCITLYYIKQISFTLNAKQISTLKEKFLQ